jgi:hypothetical protein
MNSIHLDFNLIKNFFDYTKNDYFRILSLIWMNYAMNKKGVVGVYFCKSRYFKRESFKTVIQRKIVYANK